MTRGALITAGLAVFLAGLLAMAPARVLTDLAGGTVTAERVSGRIWSGSATGVRAGGWRLDRVDWRLPATPLLTGRARFHFEIRDSRLNGRGVLTFHPGGWSASEVDGTARAGLFPGVVAQGIAPSAPIRVSGAQAAFSSEGCEQAGGTVRSAALTELGERYEISLPGIEAQLDCAASELALNAQARGESMDARGQVRFSASGHQWQAYARPSDRRGRAALRALGFEQRGEEWNAQGSGRW